MYFELERILKNKDCKRIEFFDIEFIVYRCGYVFKKTKGNTNKWKLLNLNKKRNEYIQINLTNKRKKIKFFLLHRIVFYAFNSDWNIMDSSTDNSIDHKNGNTVDNRLSNLRNVTNQHNQFNTKCKGYSFNKKFKKYQAYIRIDNKLKHLGYFKTKTGARLKYLRTKEILHKITNL